MNLSNANSLIFKIFPSFEKIFPLSSHLASPLQKHSSMKEETRIEEKKKLEEKLRHLRTKLVQGVEKKKFFGLDYQVRQIQKNFQLIGRI